MTAETRATCRDALYARLEALQNDLRTNSDYYDRHDWRGQQHRKAVAVELRAIRRALAELRFIDWGMRGVA